MKVFGLPSLKEKKLSSNQGELIFFFFQRKDKNKKTTHNPETIKYFREAVHLPPGDCDPPSVSGPLLVEGDSLRGASLIRLRGLGPLGQGGKRTSLRVLGRGLGAGRCFRMGLS